MKKQSLLRIAALLMAMLMVLAAFAGCRSKNKKSEDDDVDTSAQAVFRNALAGFVSDLGQRDEFRPFVNALKGGSMEFRSELDIGEMNAIFGGNSDGTVTAGGKIYFGELTFTKSAGFGKIEPFSFDEKMGSWLELPQKKEK